jgi:ERCC4-type nuclease
MKIAVDYREVALLNQLQKQNSHHLSITRENLTIGDVVISSDGSPLIIIERKTLNDLSASIKDGRYKEQTFRLNILPLSNHSIFFLIEGKLQTYPTHPRFLPKATILSAMVTLSYTHGFSTHRTETTSESAEWILNLAQKLRKIQTNVPPVSETPIERPVDYTDLLPKKKQKYVTPSNICPLMLTQIPGVGSQTAKGIAKAFPTLPLLITALKSDPETLTDIQIYLKSGKSKKLDHKTKTRIYQYLQIEQADLD